MFSNFTISDNFIIEFTTGDGAVLYFNLKPFLDLGDFQQLRNLDVLKACEIDELGGLNWKCGVSLSANTLMAHAYRK
ncbi:DUF2442 domain-containing protein [Clostridium perfringens]|uniref:DUF2442 domain-containing protein n=1 Tax=Clostridium perfringens TaxID=1502 RepID=UPI00214DE099|nr:DUF2442 domain-containing protein [Clostridium perfringens]MDM0804693.1 DUF2442 domain-containing protein [Clostridium perfringens]UUW67484.1 DUF2442 domain-containing protein [Clostridium perfringens]